MSFELSDENKQFFAGLYILKLMDIPVSNGGIRFSVPLEPQYYQLEPVFDELMMSELIEIDTKNAEYKLSQNGINVLGGIIDEAESYIQEFDDVDTHVMLNALHQRNLDVFRVRFLWGLYIGEFDDLVGFQRKRNFPTIERDWPTFLLSDEFYENLALDVQL